MENASKAILIAGGILMGVILLAALVIVFTSFGGVFEEQGEALTVEQLEKYNRQFNTFDKSLYGSELLSLANLVADYNERVLFGEDPQYISENKIEVTVDLATYNVDIRYDDNGNPIRPFVKITERGIYGLVEAKNGKESIKEMAERLEGLSKTSEDSKTSLTELKSLPFKCIKRTYNSAGRIKTMHFEQQVDEDIVNNIHRR